LASGGWFGKRLSGELGGCNAIEGDGRNPAGFDASRALN
jgi:hypothetical protein